MTIRSHPEKYLYEHLKETALTAAGLISEAPVDFVSVPKEILRDLSYIEGACHDFGKCTRYFQEYLLSGGKMITGPKNHALISALAAKSAADAYLTEKQLGAFEKRLLPLFVFTSVRRHHGNLNNFVDELSDLEEKSDELKQQASSLIRPETDEILKEVLQKVGLDFNVDEFIGAINNNYFTVEFDAFHLEVMSFGEYEALSLKKKIEYFYIHELLYSVLLHSDKADVILTKQPVYAPLKSDIINKYRRKKHFDKPEKEIDCLKNEAYNSAIENVRKVFNPAKHIYSITLPTGLGKTITSFAAALEMKKLIAKDSRLIIIIPFTSIIDQNYEVYSEILQDPDSTMLLKHHHLAEPKYKCGDEELDYDQSQFLIESWNSNVVVTTFVQLLECLFSCDKSKLLKLPNIAGAVIILDEVQSIDYEYWPLIREAFHVIGNSYGCYFIFMSATQPLIFDPSGEIAEIIPDYRKYFRSFNRTKIRFLSKDEIILDELISNVCRYTEEKPSENILVILNTKRAIKEFFEKLKNSIDFHETDIYFLNTLITPFERKQIIKKIKERKSNRRFIAVSTQLIEAGVDISVDCVFREIASLDSLIQAGGRANRYAERVYPCSVFLFILSENKKNTNRIYGSELITKTKIVLDEFLSDEIEEKDYLKMIERYFQEVSLQSEAVVSDPMNNICRLDFALVNKFKLIPESRSESVYAAINNEAEEIWRKYVSIYSDRELDIFKKNQEFSKIKSRFYDYVINVPVPYNQKQINIDCEKEFGFYYIDPKSGSYFYNYDPEDLTQNTGYQTDETIFITG